MNNITDFLGLNKPKTKVLFLSSEEAPFAKVGGLGEVAFSLPRALKYIGFDARVMMPLYGSVDQEKFKLHYAYQDLKVPTGLDSETNLICNVKKYQPTEFARNPVITYFLENQEYYELRSNVYGYADDHIRFALLSRGCLEFINAHKEWVPDIIVCADWMSGYLPNILKTEYQDNKILNKITTVFTIHNLAAQGTDKPQRFIAETDRDDGFGPISDFFSDRIKNINPVRRAIIYADIVNTVSPTYAEEITTEEYGEGLEKLLCEKRSKLSGILNGIDYETNNPATDISLASKFTVKNIEAREKNKIALQKRLGLPESNNVFSVGIVSRLSSQKGFGLLQPIIDSFLKITHAQLIVIGTGGEDIMDFFHNLNKKYPDQVLANLQYDNTLPHLVYAGCDVVLIPSKFEPSGLTQMEAMRFGAIPVARRTGGLADTIDDINHGENKGTGFLFDEMDSQELLISLTMSFTNWQHKAEWKAMQKRAMSKDFSWDRSAREYAELFKTAIVKHGTKTLPTTDTDNI